MRIRKFHFALFIGGAAAVATLFNNCGKFAAAPGSNEYVAAAQSRLTPPLVIQGDEPNVVLMDISANIPLVSVKICTPGTTVCQTIPDILVDTGSVGLRIYSQLVTVPLSQLSDTSGNLVGECYLFGSGFSFFGPVRSADVTLGGETAHNISIQIVQSTFKTVPTDCNQNNTSRIATGPAFNGVNGILGIGQFVQDCGENCTPDSSAAIYYLCQASGSTCNGVIMPTKSQVGNPIAFMSAVHNGYAIQIPDIPSAGTNTISGAYLILGISTQANNTPAGVTTLATDDFGNMTTYFGGRTLPLSFIDSGSFYSAFTSPTFPTIPTCTFRLGGYSQTMFCPSTPTTYSAGLQGHGAGGSQLTLNFQLMNGQVALTDPVNTNFNNLALPIEHGLSADGSAVAQMFDWGLPVFYGKTIFFGMAGATIPGLGTGPFYGL